VKEVHVTNVSYVAVNVRMPKEIADALRKQAENERRTISAVLTYALEKYLEGETKPSVKPRGLNLRKQA
jgi:hypothetical protein